MQRLWATDLHLTEGTIRRRKNIMKKDEYWLWLSNMPNMWQGKMNKMLGYFKGPEEIYYSNRSTLEKTGFIKEKEIDIIINHREKFSIENMQEYMERNRIKFITIDNPRYPESLKNIHQKPLCLYVKGGLPHRKKAVSIVGARACTNYGRQAAKELGRALAEAGVDVISGLARGIDTYGHIGALEAGGKTYAVLGCGVDVCYPNENIELYEDIEKSGGIISEYPPGTKPAAWQFPQRNRIISGLSQAVIVVEARKRSGSLITAELAIEQGMDVLVVPGRMFDDLSEGCNSLIKEGAEIILNSQDMLNSLGIEGNIRSGILNNVLEKDFEVVYSETDLLPISFEELVTKTEFTSERVYEILLKLQLKNLIFEPVKNYYARKI